MSAKSIFGYSLLFFILFLLITAHPIFVLIFFIAIIAVIIHKVKQRKISKINYSRTYPQNYSPPAPSSISNEKNSISTNQNDASPISNKSNYARLIPGSDQLEKSTTLDVSTMPNQKEQTFQESFEKNYDEIIQKKSFNRTYWNFRYDEGIENKKRKFLEAIALCEQNNIGSKAKLRRLKMKIDRWSVENERDIEAMIPDYESLIDLIEEFETQ